MRSDLIISGLDPKQQLVWIELIRRIFAQKVAVFFWGWLLRNPVLHFFLRRGLFKFSI